MLPPQGFASMYNVDTYVTADYRYAVEQVFPDLIRQSMKSHIRRYGDMYRSAFGYYFLAVGKGHLKFVGRKESLRLNIHRGKFMKRLRRYNPELFCLNDSQRVSDADRAMIKPFLEELFPEKSSYEK